MKTLLRLLAFAALVATGSCVHAQTPAIDWPRVEAESMEHFQAVLRFDTSDPPGNERPAAEYLKQVLEREGIATKVFELEPNRLNVVARLKGSGKKRPLAADGAHRHRQRRSRKVDVPAVQRDAQRWLRVRARDRRRQRQRHRGADDDAAAEAIGRGARSRRDLSCGGRRRGHDAGRHPVHGAAALRRD